MSRAQTEKGLLNVNNVRLGYVWIWDRSSDQIQRVDIISPQPSNRFSDPTGYDASVSFETGAKFNGNVSLTDTEISALEAEVSRRSTLKSKNLRTDAFRSPVQGFIDALNGNPERFVASLQLMDVINSNGKKLYVIADEVGFSEFTNLSVDGRAAVGTEFEASSVKANLKFEVIDAGKLEFRGRDGSLAPTFFRFSIIKPSLGEGDIPKFRTETSVALTEFLDLVKQGEF
ncbi:hypothetical protein [Ruegeria sp. HKCCD6228]|uniref:hypothetical protein n=1 Tax=Ruegeria sp. HKCCD6228 TaxID=2683001 RepID=UPI0014909AC9|nr:hypothetical protein [Ruegeria sp. HKCCD6228]